MEFDFDLEIQSSRVYQLHLRSLLRRRTLQQVRRDQTDRNSSDQPSEALGILNETPNAGIDNPLDSDLISTTEDIGHHLVDIDSPFKVGRTALEIASDVHWDVMYPHKIIGGSVRGPEIGIPESKSIVHIPPSHQLSGSYNYPASSNVPNQEDSNSSEVPTTALLRIWTSLRRQGRMAGILLEASRSYGVHCP